MDSMIYYEAPDLGRALAHLCPRVRDSIVFTVAPRTPLLMAFWWAGRMFPRDDRSPLMVPHALDGLRRHAGDRLTHVARVNRGFYISDCLEYRP
jgi:magnesium-protoporphyrin O-methyltransferase